MVTDKKEELFDMYGRFKCKHLKSGMGTRTGEIGVPTAGPVFGCCGAMSLQSMAGMYLTSEEHRQEFAYQMTQLWANRVLYFLPTTDQMRRCKDRKDSVLHMLFELGAKEVDVTPNRVHGPNNLHLCVLDPGSKEHKEAQLKYLVKHTVKDRYGYNHTALIPKYAVAEEPVKEVVAKKTPVRDALGRFVRQL